MEKKKGGREEKQAKGQDRRGKGGEKGVSEERKGLNHVVRGVKVSHTSPHPHTCTSHLFQEVVLNVTSSWVTLEVKVNIHVLAKPTGIIVPVGLGITKRLHDLIGPNQHVGHPARVGMVEYRITQL